MATKEARDMAERVSDAIVNHREDVSGKNTSSPHLYKYYIKKTDDGGMKVKYWSNQGTFHNCRITAFITADGMVTFDHCDCGGMKKLVRLVREEIE